MSEADEGVWLDWQSQQFDMTTKAERIAEIKSSCTTEGLCLMCKEAILQIEAENE